MISFLQWGVETMGLNTDLIEARDEQAKLVTDLGANHADTVAQKAIGDDLQAQINVLIPDKTGPAGIDQLVALMNTHGWPANVMALATNLQASMASYIS
jgi:non-homologous end joining protein Ku